MYKDFFGIAESPFSIVPSARFLYLSERHREALTHMLASLSGGGGFGLLTGEVGTGKTTVLRALVARLPQETQVAMVLNPALSAQELLASICDELGLTYPQEASFKALTDCIYRHLLANHSAGKQTLLLVDEAQHLMPDVLEQLRLLTNLETDSIKLLKVVLVGQPELQQLLQQERLRQLAQRITSRYHLLPLTAEEVDEYIHYRLQAVECLHKVFEPAQTRQIARATGGIPRLINLVCDKAMLLACQQATHQASKAIVSQACDEVLSWQLPGGSPEPGAAAPQRRNRVLVWGGALLVGGALSAGIGYQSLQPAGWLSQLQQHFTQHPGDASDVMITAEVASHAAPEPAMVVRRTVPEIELSPEPQPGQPVTMPPPAKIDPEQRWQAVVAQSRSERQAMQTLYRLWGYETRLSQANCETSQRVALSCYQGKAAELEQLRIINRPVLVTLQEPGQPHYYAVVYTLAPEHAELLLGGERVAVSYAWLQQRWQPGYTLLWRPPLGEESTIRYGQRGERVRWLNQHLSLLLGEAPTRSDRFDQVLLERLRRFQRAQDLAADGIAGPQTLMVIDSALNLPGPTLHPEKS
ncbi:ExeA family protein [Photobacterium atrarenae]|uniref:AAA family ATPase n=1 Tax=Photobacterium atrarenae TaxID=865757 RepID=A0ABY5GEZ7_9GAMM|nr:AAA family ATPase [Photobacterium atrarenae]UTV27400.1 AAA family ATPase [Photobacterium atrarenae]